MIETVEQARAARASILRRVLHALDSSERWYGFYLWIRGSKFPRGRRYAIRCRAMAAVIHSRVLVSQEVNR